MPCFHAQRNGFLESHFCLVQCLFPWVLWAHRKLQGICTVNPYFHDLAPQIRFPKEELQAQYPIHRQDHTQTAESQLLLSSNWWGDPAAAQQLMERGKSAMCPASSGTENPLVPSNVWAAFGLIKWILQRKKPSWDLEPVRWSKPKPCTLIQSQTLWSRTLWFVLLIFHLINTLGSSHAVSWTSYDICNSFIKCNENKHSYYYILNTEAI